MENANVISATPSPKRSPQNRSVLRERQIEARRSLFERTDSDLSDISPLSRTSSELISPEKKSPFKVVTPFKVKGVRHLSPDLGIIKPSLFYGCSKSATASLDGAAMYREIRKSLTLNSKARTCLFLDDLPRNQKRSRSSGNPNESIKQDRKKIKLQPSLKHDIRKPSKTELRHREILKRKKAKRQMKENKIEEKRNKIEKVKRKYNWEIFNTSEDLHKFTWRSSVVMTPPHSTKKKRLMGNHYDYLSPIKLKTDEEDKKKIEKENTGEKRNLNEDLVQEIREGVLDMMKDDEDDEIKLEVGELLDRLGGEEIEKGKKTDVQNEEIPLNNAAGPGPAADNEENSENIEPFSTPTGQKFFPLFSSERKHSSCNSSFPASLPSSKSSYKKKLGLGLDQLQLDVGQNNLREIECTGCGLMYVQGNPEDVAEHEIFHFKFKELHFNGWKNERVVRYDGLSRIVCVRNSDCKQWWKKALNVLEVIDSELGYPSQGSPTNQIYMYVTGKFIRGVVAVSQLTRAYKMLHVDDGGDDVGLCSEEEYPVKCLISRIWVDAHFRRCNVATTLLDSVRSNYAFGCILKSSDMAFSSPTDDGRKFIESYSKTKEYFVYI